MVGRFYFAWVDATEAFDAAIHAREDEQVFALTVSESEGEFAMATVEIRNPRQGLLSPARRQRCFISAEIDSNVTLLFSGRVVGVPAAINRETVELEFLGRPDDWKSIETTAVEGIKSDPRYHSALLPEEQRSELSAVLEGFAGFPHWDRRTGALAPASICRTGYEPVVDIGTAFFEDTLDVSFAAPPVNRVKVVLDVSWEQVVPVRARLYEADPGGLTSGGPIAQAAGGRVRTLTGSDFAARWPATGDSLDGGWTVLSGFLVNEVVGTHAVPVDVVAAPPRPGITVTTPSYSIEFFESVMSGALAVEAEYRQPRREIVTLDVSSDLQPVVDYVDVEEIGLTVDAAEIAGAPETFSFSFLAPADPGDPTSGDTVLRTINQTINKGHLTRSTIASRPEFQPVLTAAMARAEARLRAAARCVTAAFETSFEIGQMLSVATVVRIADDRIPGGQMYGKVTALELVADGSSSPVARVTIAASVGRADFIATPEVTVEPYPAPAQPLVVSTQSASHAVVGTPAIRNSIFDQQAALAAVDVQVEASRFAALGYAWAQQVDDLAAREALTEVLSERPTEVDVRLVSLEPRDETVVAVTATTAAPLAVPADIVLE